MSDSFFKLKSDEQLEKILKSKDLCLLQAVIGKRCPAFLQYCASFYICKINILEAHKQVENVRLKALEYYLGEVSNGRSPKALEPSAHVLQNAIQEGRTDLQSNRLSNVSHSNKFLLSSKYKTAQTYVQETNIGNLCMMSSQMIDAIYENLVKSSLSDIKLSGNLKEIKSRLEALEKKRQSETEKYKDQLQQYKKALTEMRDATFLQDWYNNLLNQLIDTADNHKNHLLHKDVYSYSQGRGLDTAQESLIKSKIYAIKNKEIFKKAFFKIFQSKSSFECDEVEETYNEVLKCENVNFDSENIMTKDFIDNLKGIFKEDEKLCSNKLIEFFLNNISLSCLIDAEQIFLDEMLFLARKFKQTDAALLLIFNGANYQNDGKLKPLPLEKPLVLEIKRLYKDMPHIKLPFFSLNELIKFLPEEELLHKISEPVIEQKKDLNEKKDAAEKFLKGWENSNFFIHWIIKHIVYKFKMYRITNAETGMQSLEKSIIDSAGIGTADLFFEELIDIIKADGFFSLNKGTFKKLKELGDKIENSSLLTVGTFARNLNLSKRDFITGIKEEEKISQAKEHSKEKVCQLTMETIEVARQKEKEQAKNYTLEEDREQLRREREEASIEKTFLEAKSEALDLLYDKADERQLQVKRIDPPIKNQLVDYLAYYILNTKSLKEFKDIYDEYEKLENDFKAQIIDLRSLNKKVSKLNAYFESAKSRFLERQHREIKLLELLTFTPDKVINDLLTSTAEQMTTSRKFAHQKQTNIEILIVKFPKDVF